MFRCGDEARPVSHSPVCCSCLRSRRPRRAPRRSRPSICSASPSAATSAMSARKSSKAPSPGDSRNRTERIDAGSGTMSVEFVPMENLRTEFTAVVNSYDITGVSGLADQRYFALGRVLRRHPLSAAGSRVRAVRLCDRRRTALGPRRRHHRRAGQPIWRRLCRRGRLGDRARPHRRGVQSDLSARHHALGSDRALVAGIHRGRGARRDGADPSRDLRRWRSALFAPV